MTLHKASVSPRTTSRGVSWDVRWREDGRSRQLAFTTQQHAERWAKVLRNIGPTEAVRFLQTEAEQGVPTVDEYATRYIATKSGVEGKTTDQYRMYMRLHISPTFGQIPLNAVSPESIAAWVNAQQGKGLSAKTIKNHHGLLYAMFAEAVHESIIARNPCERSRLPRTEQQEMVFLTPNEFTTLLGYIPPRYQTLITFLMATGARWGEATALRATDFDLDAATPYVRISRAWKRSVQDGYYVGPPKTKKSRRTISLPEQLATQLRPLLDAGTEYVFTNTRGGPLRQAQFYATVWEPARRLANGVPAFEGTSVGPWRAHADGMFAGMEPAGRPLGKWPRIHDIRHSSVAMLLAAGVGMDIIQARLGHESITTTIGTYGHATPDRMRGAADAVSLAMAGAMPQLEG